MLSQQPLSESPQLRQQVRQLRVVPLSSLQSVSCKGLGVKDATVVSGGSYVPSATYPLSMNYCRCYCHLY